MTAKMIPILKITDGILTASTVPETDHAAWAVGTTYAVGAKVIKNHVRYESVQAGNVGHDPVADVLNTWWVPLGATNRWAVFDGVVQNQASQATAMSWSIVPGRPVSAVSMFNIGADEAVITVTDPIEGLVYNETISLQDETGVFDAWTYFFTPIVMTDTLCLTDLPPYGAATIVVTLNRPTGTASLGQLAFGFAEELGMTINEVPMGIEDYTKLNEDAFGRTTPVIRGYARTASPAIAVDTVRIPYLERLLADHRGVPVIWAFDTRYGDNVLAYIGFYRSMSFLYTYAEKTTLDLEIRSLV